MVTVASPAPVSPATRIALKDILFATDFSEASEHALPYLRLIATKFHSAVHLCHIERRAPLAGSLASTEVFEATAKVTAERLTALLNAPQLRGLNLNLALGSGKIKDELLNVIRDRNIDLVVAGTHGRSGWRKAALGSVAEEIIHCATCPVLVVGPSTGSRGDGGFGKILLPVDLTDSHDKVLPYVALLGSEFSSQVTVLHVIPDHEAESTGDPRAVRRAIQRALEKTVAPRLEPFVGEFVVEHGEPGETIVEVARERGIDLIAMGIRHNSNHTKQLRSGVAYKVITEAGCPVLAIH